MKACLVLVAALLLSASTPSGFAYGLYVPSYEELFTQSDFVVIAMPLSAPRETSERFVLPNISPPEHVIGVSTDFKTLLVLKGSKKPRFTLHHYDFPRSQRKVVHFDGPGLLTFDPAKQRKCYLMFLLRERDGRFAPVNGPSDPDGISVQEVEGWMTSSNTYKECQRVSW